MTCELCWLNSFISELINNSYLQQFLRSNEIVKKKNNESKWTHKQFRGYMEGYSKLETHVETDDKAGQSPCVHTTI